jgi:hypothetical protein
MEERADLPNSVLFSAAVPVRVESELRQTSHWTQ